MPCIQTLAHLNSIFRWNEYNNVHDCNDILLCGEEETYKLIDDMFKTLESCFTSRTVNIGMDEAHMLGRGKYQDLHGYEDRFDILLKHLERVAQIAANHGFEAIMWGDMFFRLANGAYGGVYDSGKAAIPEKISKMIPENVNLIYWDYYSTEKENYCRKIKSHSQIKENIWFAGGLYTWVGFAPHNNYSMRSMGEAVKACQENSVKDVFMTLWGDNGGECSRFAVLPSLFYVSQLAHGITDLEIIKKNFEQRFNIAFDDYMLLDLPDTPNDRINIRDSEKYLLYNDCFMGLFDNTVTAEYGADFGKAAEKLEKFVYNKDFGILFNSLAKLCRVLEIKADLGVRTRKAYLSGDKAELELILKDYEKTVAFIKEFHKAYENQWMWENKPHGFDVQDIRIGGVIMRLEHCKDRLIKYISGEILKIEELEEPTLDANCRQDGDTDSLYFNSWERSVTANVI